MDRLTNVNGVNLVRTCKMGHFTCISTLNDKTSIQYSPQRPHVGEQFGSNDLKHPKTERFVRMSDTNLFLKSKHGRWKRSDFGIL